MQPIIHRTAIDNIAEGTLTTYCGKTFSLFDDDYHEDNEMFNCPECKKELNKE